MIHVVVHQRDPDPPLTTKQILVICLVSALIFGVLFGLAALYYKLNPSPLQPGDVGYKQPEGKLPPNFKPNPHSGKGPPIPSGPKLY